jgi:hypothetical protein
VSDQLKEASLSARIKEALAATKETVGGLAYLKTHANILDSDAQMYLAQLIDQHGAFAGLLAETLIGQDPKPEQKTTKTAKGAAE